MGIEVQGEQTRQPTQQREVERKYDIPDDAGAPDFSALGGGLTAGEPSTEKLIAEYVDTPDLAILGARCVLRRRTGGDDEGWHLKRPRSGDERIELHAPVGAPRRVPPELRAEFAEILGDRPVLPLVELTTLRTTTEIRGSAADDAGPVVALVCEDAVHARVVRLGSQRELEWREFEVELVDDADLTVFDEIERVLFAAGLVPSVHRSKMVRSLAGVEPAQPISARGSVGDAVVAALASCFGELQANEALARSNAPDAVHQARVAVRRLRSLLTVFREVFDDGATDALRDELRWAGRVLGDPRDAEVLAELLGAELDALAEDETELRVDEVRRRVLAWLDVRHAEAFGAFSAAVDARRWDALHAAVVEFLADPPFAARAELRAGGAMRRALRDAMRRVEARTDRARKKPARVERWHDVRKAVKAVRYGFEALEGVPGLKPGGERKAWKRAAKAFGVVQDGALLEEELSALIDRVQAEAGDGVEWPGESVEVLEIARERVRDRRDADLTAARDLLDELV
ncbi:CHAD domain-containing protein [Pseudoclavibacter helvolus]|uniref:CYTH and CHAD domain-containing protein n=1 Tax=Pseudoclavibacter helvolus TaxID=255205 RepID=UPI003C755387